MSELSPLTASAPDGCSGACAGYSRRTLLRSAIVGKGADGKPIILSQPVASKVVGMSAVCTHAGCTVAPDGSDLVRPCHGSVSKAADGSSVSGPAPTPLPSVAVRVEGDSVFAA